MRLMFLVCVFTLFSCSSFEPNIGNDYFNGETYFKEQADKFTNNKSKLEKYLSFNTQVTYVISDTPNWLKEFAPFIELNLAKNSYTGRFDFEETNNKKTYISIDKKTDIKQYDIHFTNKEISKIEITIADKNNVYASNKTLIYYPDSLFVITGNQKVTALNSAQYKIKGEIK